MEEPPSWISGTTAFEDEAVCLAFGAIVIEDSMLEMKERRRTKKTSFLNLTDANEEEGESNDDS